MAASTYTHKLVQLECSIESCKPAKMKLPSADDWDKNVNAILKKIGQKFKFLANMKDEEWILTVIKDGQSEFIDKNDAVKFGETLSSVPPKAVITVVKTPKQKPQIQFEIDFNSKMEVVNGNTMNLEASDEKDWNDNFSILSKEIESRFSVLGGQEYEIQDSDECEVSDGSELQSLCNEATSPQIALKIIYEAPKPLIIEAPKQIRIQYNNGAPLLWSPPNPGLDESVNWEDNYADFVSVIEAKCNIDRADIDEIQDGDECGIGDGDELKGVWEAFVNDKDAQTYDVTLVLSVNQAQAQAQAQEEPQEKQPEQEASPPVKEKEKEPEQEQEAPPEQEQEQEPVKEKEKEKEEQGGDDGKDDGKDDSKEEKKSDEDDSKGAGAAESGASARAAKPIAEEDEILSIDALLNELDFDVPNMSDKLNELGSSVGLLPEDKKIVNYNALKGILEGAERGGASATQQFEELLNGMLSEESQKYAKCALRFIKLLGYGIKSGAQHKANTVILDGQPDKDSLNTIKINLHHLSNAMQKPIENIYQQLKISVPKAASVGFHKSGLLDNAFITFQLPQIVLENQQSSLVNKNILDPGDFERFVNFLVPNSSKYLCKEIYFDKLKKLDIQSIGLFGSRREVLSMLQKYNTISQALYDVLKSDNDNRYMNPGIHCILPVNLRKGNNFSKWDGVIYIFYWSLANSFDMVKMKAVKYMRKDPSCLLTRVLYEISSTVCIQVSSAELTDFGITYELDEDGKESKEEEQKADSAGAGGHGQGGKKRRKKKKKRKKRAGRRQKLNFAVEETKENMVMCNACDTKEEQLKTKTVRKDESWKYFKVGDKVGSLDSTNKWYLSEVLRVKKKTETLSEFGNDLKLWQQNQLWKFNAMEGIYVHYIGWSSKWDEWVFIDEDTLCNCVGDICTSYLHKVRSQEKQEGRGKGKAKGKKKKKDKWAKQGGNWIQTAVSTAAAWIPGVGDVGGNNNSFMTGNSGYTDHGNSGGLDDSDHNDSDDGSGGEDGGDGDDDKEDTEFDIACDTFVLEGLRMSGYCQMFKQKERPDQNTVDWTGWNAKEVGDFLTDLNKNYILEWQTSFVNKSQGINYLAWAVCSDAYDEFKKEVEVLDKEEQGERENSKIKLKVDQVLDMRHREILFEFHENYTSWKYCKKEHQDIKKILQSLQKNGALKPELTEAVAYALIEPQQTTLPKQTYSWFRESCFKKMETELSRILRIYRNKKKKNNNTKNLCIQNWFKLYKEQLGYYKNNVYGGGRYKTSVLHRESIRDEVEKKIKKEYNKKRRGLKSKLEVAIKKIQSEKPEDLKTTTLTKFVYKAKGFMNNSEKFTLTYTVPTVVPPSYYMQFMSIDLPNTSEDLRIANMKNMRFEMPQSDTLIFHQMMANGDTIMFIREDDEQTGETKTKIIASHSRVLTVGQSPLKVLKTKGVRMVAYCEAQKLFAIMMDDVLGFCIFQDGGRISITNKRCELRDIAWWNKKLKYKALLVEEINKNIWVWLVDEKNIVRAFDYDAGSWDSAKEFQLDQSYESYQLSPKGSFLIALKPQYEEEEKEEKKDNSVESEEKQKPSAEESKPSADDTTKAADNSAQAANATPGAPTANANATPGATPNNPTPGATPSTTAPATATAAASGPTPGAANAATAVTSAAAAAGGGGGGAAPKTDANAVKQPPPIHYACEDLLTYPDTIEEYKDADGFGASVTTHEQHFVIRLKFKDQKKAEWTLVMYVLQSSKAIEGMAIDKYPVSDVNLYSNIVAAPKKADPNAAAAADPNATVAAVAAVDKSEKIACYTLPASAMKLRVSEWASLHPAIVKMSSLSTIVLPSPLPVDGPDPSLVLQQQKAAEEEKKEKEELAKQKKSTGRVELHAYLLLEKKKLEYVVHASSLTGYEKGDEKEFKNTDKDKGSFERVGNVLLPATFLTTDEYVKFDRIYVMESNKKDDMLVCTITKDAKLLYHPLTIQVSEARMRINEVKKKQTLRKITKLDYMEYMIEKFGSRAAIFYPEDDKLCLHTTYIMKEQAQNADKLCTRISETVCKSLEDKEKKNFAYLTWECNVLQGDTDNISAKDVLAQVHNKAPSSKGDVWIKNMITQIPIQIARGSNNKFQLMYNGEDNQDEYVQATDAYGLCKAIRFGAYDGLIKSWEGDIKIVTSMGKQSTGKSYMLNHLFGTKFDISGGRCTDGGWLSVKVIDDILYIVCDFEGLGSFERSPQEDMLLATFNSAISNCTIFKCDNRFDRTVEDMFNKFQSGVKIMSGSQNCFTGELLLIIKDVVDTGAEAAVADFKRHIERLAQEAELVMDEKGKKQSSFFVSQMYQAGLEIIPFPPLANEAFFDELNDTLELAIDDIDIVHVGGKIFLDHIKLVMAKLHIGDFSAMSGEQAKIRSQEIRDNLKNAVEAGAIIQPSSTQYGVTFQVDDDQMLLLLDGNQVIVVGLDLIVPKIKNYKQVLQEYSKYDGNIEQTILSMLDAIDDAGLILGKVESLGFLWEQFSFKVKRTHSNFKDITSVYQLFLDLIFWRRKLRVFKFIKDNTKKFEDQEKHEIESLTAAADSRLNSIREKMRLCKQKCKECFYPCLLCKNHEDDNNWADDHSCNQTKHSCEQDCDYCADKGLTVACGDKCGHTSKHNCRSGDHTCGAKCSLEKFGGCQLKCNLESSHDKTAQKCKCAAETHYCIEKCGIPICKNSCKMPYNKQHGEHICIQQSCPYKCQVQCWNDSLKSVAPCGRPCSSDEHDHELKLGGTDIEEQKTDVTTPDKELTKDVTIPDIDMEESDSKSRPQGTADTSAVIIQPTCGHTCDQEHPCPLFCTELGNCKVEIQRKIVEKETLVTGAGSKIEYDSYAEVNAEKKRCCKKIPKHLFAHSGNEHKCYDGDISENIHTCEEQCDACGYFCQQAYHHYKDKGSFHDCVHGNMRNTVFYATEEIVDTGAGRKYQVGDAGTAEMCNIFCERMGRGHIHLEMCEYAEGKCVDEEGRRHQSKEYKPNPKKAKDEVKHSKFWRRKKWNDPCVEKFRKLFDKCNFECQHQVHAERAANGEEDEVKWCVEPLWHKDKNTPTGHTFNCKHPFSDCHVIFLCDISGSMDSTDGGTSQAQFTFIRDAPRLNNRLGALYSAIHNFLDVRLQKGCVDCVSAVMFNGHCTVGARMENATPDFVGNYLLKFTPTGGTNFGAAFNGAKDLIDDSQDSVLIFLTDGESSDNGSSNIVADLSNKLGTKFQLFCILLGKISERGNPVVEGICNAGNGTLLSALSGNELGTTFTTIAKQMNAGAFGAL